MGIEVHIHMSVNTRLINGPLLVVSLHSDMCGTCAVPPCSCQKVQNQSGVLSQSGGTRVAVSSCALDQLAV